jgi:hypothetical protein
MEVCTLFNKMEEGCIAGCRQTKASDTVVIASTVFLLPVNGKPARTSDL